MGEKDFLTGCLSKEAIDSTLDKVRAQCSYNKTPFSLLVIDLDHFKTYNDKYGHIEGDEVLKYFSSTLRLCIREEDGLIFRFGGDEFIVVFPEKSAEEAYAIAVDIMKTFKRRPFLSSGRMLRLSFSGGIASYPLDGNESDTILERADKAMYFSKAHGRRRVTLYRRIFIKVLSKSVLIFLSALLFAGALMYLQQSSLKDYVAGWLKLGIRKAGTTLTSASASVPVRIFNKESDVVYLKSGRVLKGMIKREDENAIEIDLDIDQGVGSAIIQRSDINSISKRKEEKGL
jgi:diguanylate cyclase (GGDEF)-like protein